MPIPARRRPSRAAQRRPAPGAILTPGFRRFLPGCLVVSGGSSLVLEVAWSRALSLSLGNTHQAVATVVASMMAGLCLGSLVAARALARLPRLPRAYAAVEMGIGAYAALTPLLFRRLPLLLAPLYALPPTPLASRRLLLVFLILLPPAAGMGAMLPLLTAAHSRERESVGERLYG